MVKLRRAVFAACVLLTTGAGGGAEAARVKDLASVRGVRSNQLIGYGLVVGLSGTGDDQQVYFTLRSVQLMLRRLGVQAAQEMVFDLRNLRLRNAAAVMVTTELPPFARSGSRLDVTVSSLGNATSLQGGTLIMTPLLGVDLKVYALGQGALSVGGFRVGGRTGTQATKNHTTVGRIPAGAIVEREVSSRFVVKDQMVVALTRPDFTTASRTAETIAKAIGQGSARAVDPATVVVRIPKGYSGREVELVAKVESLEVEPDVAAQVIVNERTGTVIVGRGVKLSSVAITHGALTLEVNEQLRVSQPRAAFGTGRTAVVPETTTKTTEGGGELKLLPQSASLADVVKALNALGASPRDLIAILQALETAGALPAKVVVQ